MPLGSPSIASQRKAGEGSLGVALFVVLRISTDRRVESFLPVDLLISEGRYKVGVN